MAIFNRFRNQMRRPGGFGGRFSPQQMPQQSRFGGGLGGLFGGMGGYNPYQQQNPMMGGGFNPYMGGGGFNPMMGGGFNPMMGGGFNPYMGGGGFNPMMGGGGFNPYMGGGGRRGGFGRPGMFGGGRRGGFQGYDFNSPIGEAPPGATPTPPPSISDLFSGLDDDQRNSFFQQFGLAPTPPPIERAPVDERDMFDSGSIPGGPGFSIERQGPVMGEEPTMGTMGGPVYDDAGNLIGNLGSAGPTFPPGVLDNINQYNNFLGTSPDQQPVIPSVEPDLSGGFTDGQINIPGIDLDRIRESLAKIEPIIPNISLPEPQPVPVRGPGRPMPVRPPMPVPPINEFDNPLFSDPGLGSKGGVRPMPAPMPIKGPRIAPPPGKSIPLPKFIPQPAVPVKGPPPKRISDPIKVPPRTIMPVKGPRLPIKTSPPKIRPMPMPSLPFDPDSLFSDPGLGGEVGGPVRGPIKPIRVQPQPMPMPAPMPKIRPMPAPIVAPLPRVISDPVRPKPAPITRGIGGVKRMPAGRRR